VLLPLSRVSTKWLVVVDTAIVRWCSGARGLLCGPYNGSAMLCAHLLVDAAHAVITPLGVVVADAEFNSKHNPTATCAIGSLRLA
jgi:hypothetical protein